MSKLQFIDRATGFISIDSNKYLKTKDSASPSGHSLLAQIDMTHSGIVTLNYGFYLPQKMRKGTDTFTAGYSKPVLVGHDDAIFAPESSPIGRVISAEYIDFTPMIRIKDKMFDRLLSFKDKTDKATLDFVDYVIKNYQNDSTYHGTGTIRGVLRISDAESIERILDERYLTVSTSFVSDTAMCSICGTDFREEGPCGHNRGMKYEDKLCVMIPGEMRYDHVGIVNAPADPHAHSFKILQLNDKQSKVLEIPTNEDSYKVREQEELPVFICGQKDKEFFAIADDQEANEEMLRIQDSLNKTEKEMPDNKFDVLQAIKDYFRASVDLFFSDPDGSNGTSVSMMKTMETLDPTVIEEMAKSISKVIQADSVETVAIEVKKYFDAQNKLLAEGSDETDIHFVDAWTTAFINNLPDAAFAYIEPGGSKDSDGRTTPRSLRHLPHHKSSVKSPTENTSIDKPHLRNALARVNQTKISAAAKSRATGHLRRHARALGIGEASDDSLTKILDSVTVFKINDKYKLEEASKIEKTILEKNYDSVINLKSILSSNDAYELAYLKTQFDAKDAYTTFVFPWLKKDISVDLVKDFLDNLDSRFTLSEYDGKTIYIEMSKLMDASKIANIDDIPTIAFVGGDNFFPVTNKETAFAALAVLSRCDTKDSVKNRIFSGIMKRMDKLAINKETIFDSNSQPCDNPKVDTIEDLLTQFNLIKDKLVALGYKFEEPKLVETKADDSYEVGMLEAQVEVLVEEVERLEIEKTKISDSLKDFLTDAIIKEEVRKGECEDKEEERQKRKEGLVIRTVDSLRDMAKDMMKVVSTPITELEKVANPVLTVNDETEKAIKTQNFDKNKIYATHALYARQKGKVYADKWLSNLQKQNNVIITLD